MRQMIYVSTASVTAPVQPVDILAVSQRNNSRDGITGLLYSDGKRFLQALEGDADKVEAAFARILADPRHRAVVILSDRVTDTREFGDWSMAHRTPGADGEAFMEKVGRLVRNASPSVKATFQSFAELRRAA
jgi:hypothetical protein